MHDFTVFITSYNYGNYIEKAIESVVKQSTPEWNLYILDNGSTDNTFEVIAPYLSDSRIHLIKRPTNIGAMMNINRGFIELEGKYISTLQADDWLEPEFIEKSLAAFKAHPEIGLVAFGWMAYAEATDSYIYARTIPYPRDFEGLTRLSPHLTLGNFIPLHLIAFKKSEITALSHEMIRNPLRQLCEQFIIKRIEDRNGPSFFSAEVAGYWRRHETQITSSNAQNNVTTIETIIEPLLYNQVEDSFSSDTRFLALAYFISTAANIPYRSATEWLLSENGSHLGEKYKIDLTGDTARYHCLACALLMAHTALSTSHLILIEELQSWISDLEERFGLNQKQILSVANQAYGGYFFPANVETVISDIFDQIGTVHGSTLQKISRDLDYAKWLKQREFLPEDSNIIDASLEKHLANAIHFHLVVRLHAGEEALLADTLDTLNQQCYPAWHLDIVSSLPAPDGVNELPCIGWHTIASLDESAQTINALVSNRLFQWIVELPAGARLDQLFLWRIAEQSIASPDAVAFFVDDDCSDNTGRRHSPRFKPGTNQSALLATDLAGPLAIRLNAWQATGGASQPVGSPWYDHMLRIVDFAGWSRFKHIPDILISYPDYFPSDRQTCMQALQLKFQKKQIYVETIPITKTSWRIRFPLDSAPTVSIAIISRGQLELLSRCIESLLNTTRYPHFEIMVIVADGTVDPDMDQSLTNCQANTSISIRLIRQPGSAFIFATLANTAVNATSNEFIVLLDENAFIVQENWLEELVRTCSQPSVAAVSPLLAKQGTASIHNAGNVIGLGGLIGSPHYAKAKLTDPGYLDCIQVARDASSLPASCLMIRTKDYLDVGGMKEDVFCNYLADVDLCLRLARAGRRLIFEPQAIVVHGEYDMVENEIQEENKAQQKAASAKAESEFANLWLKERNMDQFWNPNLSLHGTEPTPETSFRAQWQYLPSSTPRILARPIDNGQGFFRVSSPLRALRKAGMASECIWFQGKARDLTAPEVLRLAPDTLIAQNYLFKIRLASLKACYSLPNRPFIVYALDDLITNLSKTNPFSSKIPPNSRGLLKYALAHSDRLVVSTEFLAETYRHLIPDIRVVANRLEQETWLPLRSQKRTSKKPRIGWAGGITHQGDLILLKEIIERTRNEADWIFFGMCPEEIRPLLAEYHPLVDFHQYPAKLAALNLDIAVAPLAQIPFNQGKSNLRLLEYGMLGIPVVCTDIDPYRGSPACCVENDPKIWIDALRARIFDADAREEEGMAMRKWVQKNYLLENHLEEWLSAHLPS